MFLLYFCFYIFGKHSRLSHILENYINKNIFHLNWVRIIFNDTKNKTRSSLHYILCFFPSFRTLQKTIFLFFFFQWEAIDLSKHEHFIIWRAHFVLFSSSNKNKHNNNNTRIGSPLSSLPFWQKTQVHTKLQSKLNVFAAANTERQKKIKYA